MGEGFLDKQYPLNLFLHLSIPAFSLRRWVKLFICFLGKEVGLLGKAEGSQGNSVRIPFL